MNQKSTSSRRSFIGTGIALTSALALSSFRLPSQADLYNPSEEGLFIIGPKKGYTPLIGTLISMLENMTFQVKNNIKNFTQEQLDHQFDEHANTIGALILHITSSEKFHQIETLEERPFNEEEWKFWEAPRSLGKEISKTIKGHDIDYYLNIMDEVRADTMAKLKEKDDAWLLALDPLSANEKYPTNRFWRWFHSCEHMANHNGQIKFLKSRLPK